MEIVCDTSFLMVLCYEPVKNIDSIESRIGKVKFLIHPAIIKELSRIKYNEGIKRSNIAKLTLEIITNQVEKGNFIYIATKVNGDNNSSDGNGGGSGSEKYDVKKDVDSFLLDLAWEKKYPLATIDKNLIKRSLNKGVDVVTLRGNKIIFISSKKKTTRSNLNHS